MKVEQISYRVWHVEGDSGNEYTVWIDNKGIHCTCPGFINRRGKLCKHCREVIDRFLKHRVPSSIACEPFN